MRPRAIPAEHAGALAQLDAEHAATHALALSRAQSARGIAGDADVQRFQRETAATLADHCAATAPADQQRAASRADAPMKVIW